MVNWIAIENSIPWVFNASCICLITNFIALVGLIGLSFYVFNFIRKRKGIDEAKFFFWAIVFLILSELVAFYHGSLSFGSPTGLAWSESLSLMTTIFGFISTSLFAVFVYKLGRMVRKV